MLLWAGVGFLLFGVIAFAFDRRAAHAVHAAVPRSVHRGLARTTDWAKGAHWLAVAILCLAAADAILWLFGRPDWLRLAARAALAFLACLAAASAVLHTIKFLAGRRRPRDELEHDLYGFRLLHFDSQHDSFPSGHAMTIFCVAVVAAGLVPALWPAWFGLALYLALTRALLNAHFFSDVLIGAGIGLVVSREVLLYFFPALTQPWF
ncbi:MAG TPA: phosphatase PAP2 family protein [Rhizomicrobium sp.]|nr:phosphatase PAP2 family protein [Rhizomicrobium sp.]